MAITIIKGPPKSGKSLLANSIRNTHIGKGLDEKSGTFHGCLLIDDTQDGEPRHLLEKLIVGVALPEDGTPVPVDELPWKHDPQIVIVGDAKAKLLKTFEKLVPGFMERFGPVHTLTTA